MRLEKRSGIATVVILGIVIVIAVAGVGAYFVLSSSGGSTGTTGSTTTPMTTGTTTPMTTGTSTSTGTTSGSSTTRSTTTTSQTTYPTTSTTSQGGVTSTTSTTSGSTSQTTGTTFTDTSCATTSTTGTSTGTVGQDTTFYVGIVKQYPSMEVKFNSVSNGSTYNETLDYRTVSTSGSLRTLNVTYSGIGTSGGFNFSILSKVDTSGSGSVLWTFISEGGYGNNFTGSSATSYFDTVMTPFTIYTSYNGFIGELTNSAYFHSTGSSLKYFGPTSFQVTTYVANAANEVFDSCGQSSVLTAFQVDIGTPPGSSVQFLTYFHFAGTTTYNGSTTNDDVTFELVSMTTA